MNYEKWSNRYINRYDISSRLTHLTKDCNPEEDKKTAEGAFQTLIKILEDKKLKGSTTETGFIIGDKSAVCFQEAPLNAIAENILYEKELWEKTKGKVRYSSFGLRFDKTWIYEKGGRPVIYEEKSLMKNTLSPDEHWKIVNYDLNDREHMIDWTHEREWRVPGDLEFEYTDIEVLVASEKYYKCFIEYCIQNDKLHILREIKGIVVLNTIFY